MVPEILMAKVAGEVQAAQISTMAGNSYVVAKVTAAKNGLGSWLFLNPVSSTGAVGSGTTAIKLEGTRQLIQFTPLVGKTVVIGQSPMVAAGAGKWLVVKPVAGMAAKGAMVVGMGAAGGGLAAGSSLNKMVMLKLEGGRAATQVAMLQGQSFVVADPVVAGKGVGKWLFLKPVGGSVGSQDLIAIKLSNGKAAAAVPSLVGKTVTIGKSPMVAGKISKWIVLKPAFGATGKTAFGIGGGKFVTAAMTTSKGAAGSAMTGKAAMAGAAAVKTAAASGTIWTGTGLSLGLGLGLGAWGPALLIGAATAGGYYMLSKRKKDDSEIAGEVLPPGFESALA